MIDLQRYCADDDDPRDYLWTPFNVDGKTIATNGHIMVIVDEQEQYSAPHSSFEKTVKSIIAEIEPEKMKPMEKIKIPEGSLSYSPVNVDGVSFPLSACYAEMLNEFDDLEGYSVDPDKILYFRSGDTMGMLKGRNPSL